MARWFVLGVIAMACGGAQDKKIPAAGSNAEANPAASPYTVAIMYQGRELWIGNDEIPDLERDDPSRTRGVLGTIKAAFAKIDLAHSAPPGSRGMLVSYANKAVIRTPIGPIANITSGAFGTQKDYFGNQGNELVRGVTMAVDELANQPPGRKFLVVISDGTDVNPDAARSELAKLAERCRAHGIEVSSLVYKDLSSEPGSVLPALTSNTRRAGTSDSLLFDLTRTFDQFNQKPAPTTPPVSTKTGPYAMAFVFEGLEIWIGNDEIAEFADDPSATPGALKSIKAAFDKVDLAHTAPKGSRAMAITYGERPAVRLAMGPIDKLTSSVFGIQQDYVRTKGAELVRAIELAVDELTKLPPGRKILFVLSDGYDVDHDSAVTLLAETAARVKTQGIEVIALVYSPIGLEKGAVNLLQSLGKPRIVKDLEVELVQALEQLRK